MMDRLDDMVGSPGIECGQRAGPVIFGGHHDHRNRQETGDLAEDRETRLIREAHVEEDQGRPGRRRPENALSAVRCCHHVEPPDGEPCSQGTTERLEIVSPSITRTIGRRSGEDIGAATSRRVRVMAAPRTRGRRRCDMVRPARSAAAPMQD